MQWRAVPPPVILGGVGFSIAPCEALRFAGAPYGVWGDGEQALPDLLDCLAAGGDVSRVPAVVYWMDGVLRAMPPRPFDPANGPSRRRRFLDHLRYFAEGGQGGIETKRGCGHACIYCVEPHAKGGHVRLMPPERAADEIAFMLDHGVDVFHLCDSEFNQPPEHARAVCEAIVRRGLHDRIRWYTYASPVPFDKDLARAMRRSGCAGIDFGVDHIDKAMLRRLGRNHDAGAVRRAVEACRDAGIAVMTDMLLGSPGETHESLAHAIAAMREMAPDCVGLSCGVRVYPHTPLAAKIRRQGPLHQNPHLHGCTRDNDDLLRPIFYVDASIGGDLPREVSALVGGDPRFFHADPAEADGNYNYNDNSRLANAIREGARGGAGMFGGLHLRGGGAPRLVRGVFFGGHFKGVEHLGDLRMGQRAVQRGQQHVGIGPAHGVGDLRFESAGGHQRAARRAGHVKPVPAVVTVMVAVVREDHELHIGLDGARRVEQPPQKVIGGPLARLMPGMQCAHANAHGRSRWRPTPVIRCSRGVGVGPAGGLRLRR